MERHTCFEVFLELYEPLITFLDAIISPREYPQLETSDGSWNWDTETRTRAQGLKASLSSFQMISVFLITKNVLDEAKSLSAKLQKRNQDVYQALQMVNSVKRVVAIPLLDSLISQLNERFNGENRRHTQSLLSLVPSRDSMVKTEGTLDLFFLLYHQSCFQWIQSSQTRTSCFGKKSYQLLNLLLVN